MCMDVCKERACCGAAHQCGKEAQQRLEQRPRCCALAAALSLDGAQQSSHRFRRQRGVRRQVRAQARQPRFPQRTHAGQRQHVGAVEHQEDA